MEWIAISFFENLFTSQQGVGNNEHLLFEVNAYITQEDNLLLSVHYTNEKVVELKDMGPTKAPSMDGFSTFFSKIFAHCLSKCG